MQAILSRVSPRQWLHSFARTLFLSAIVGGCDSDYKSAPAIPYRNDDCADKICKGDVVPTVDYKVESVFKIGGRWYAGPKNKIGQTGGSFYQPLRWPKIGKPPSPPISAKGVYEKSVPFVHFYLRSTNIPPPPYASELVELAEKNDWISERRTLRPGVDQVRVKSDVVLNGRHINTNDFIIATDIVGLDGRHPVAACNESADYGAGGAGFLWKDGILVELFLWPEQCRDWPEIYMKMIDVLNKVRRIQ